jgi:glycosyltransferase involved in cell wall biosynthesis
LLIGPAHHPPSPSISKPEMKLLVLAQTPPPLHGQSAMVQAMVEGLPARGIALHHVNLRLSRDAADIGRWRPAKIFATLACALRAIAARFRRRCDTLYYVPAPPGKRGALYRDWLLLALCRPFFPRLILHWHAVGLGEWLEREANAAERAITRALLGRADLAIVLAEPLRDDAGRLQPRRVAVVPNGIPDPGAPTPAPAGPPFHALFLAAGSEEKGLFLAAEAVIEANREHADDDATPAFVLTAAGPFTDAATAARWRQLAEKHPGVLRHAGVAGEAEKRRLFAQSHALLFPTHYAAEGLPLVAIEALAHDRPVIATEWRGLPAIVSGEVGILVPPREVQVLAAALRHLRAAPPRAGVCRDRFLRHFTIDAHLAALHRSLSSVDSSAPAVARPPA